VIREIIIGGVYACGEIVVVHAIARRQAPPLLRHSNRAPYQDKRVDRQLHFADHSLFDVLRITAAIVKRVSLVERPI
jgi:hypothetical protein